jgi:hypothetical protein
MTVDDGRLSALAKGQHGVFSRLQARQAGLTDNMLRSRVQSGILVKVGISTFSSPLIPDSVRRRLAAAILDVGEPVWVSHRTAAALHGFDGFALKEPFDLLFPRGRFVERPATKTHTTKDHGKVDTCTVEGFPVTSATRTIIDLAACEPVPRMVAAIDSAVRDRLTTEHFLRRRVVELRTRGRHGVPALADILDGERAWLGGHSYLERRFLELLRRHGLPRPRTQVVTATDAKRVIRVDCLYEGTPLVVELLGFRWHRTAADLTRDARRISDLVLAGYRPLQFTYEDVVLGSRQALHRLRRALAAVGLLPNAA